MATEHYDVLIMGAGLSGIDAACHLRRLCPGRSFVLLEQREAIGGTWDLFRYPGVRSDSDMFTMSYGFRPWVSAKAIGEGSEILEYLATVARENGIAGHIRFRQKVRRASWSSQDACWRVEAERSLSDGSTEPVRLTCGFLFSCTGYYRYSSGYTPEFPGIERFGGRVVHPQAWPADLDYSGKRVVIIGSGATAVTLLPAMAETASHVTMLQRSPTYVVALPGRDAIAPRLQRAFPAGVAHRLMRWKNLLYMMYIYQMARRRPELAKAGLLKLAQGHLGPDYDVATHFSPRYNPWEQRLCLAPDADFFRAIRSGRASVATDEIETFTEGGIRLKSGSELEADVVVTATGLVLQIYGGAELAVDGETVISSERLSYKGLMVAGVPNFASVFGYINASWTLKADLICAYVCGLLNAMDRKGVRQVMPRAGNEAPAAEWVEHFNPGYFQRGAGMWPKQGAEKPWRVHQNYFRDLMSLKWERARYGGLEFSNPRQQRSSATPELAEVGD
jgi:cation diffusion facilitator CzcD-associated flavoprotein CzcO